MKKKVLALLMAVALTLGICVPAFGDEDSYTLTLNNAQPGHTYTAYRIFEGDLHVTETETILSNVAWGSGVTDAGKAYFGDAATKAADLEKGGASAVEAFAAEVAEYLDSSAGSVTIAAGENAGVISGLPAGYYLVKTTNVAATDGVYTYYIMKVVKDTAATVKADVPTVDKAIVGDNDDAKVSDVNIGDTVIFKLTATMPSTLEGYDTYKVVFHDTLSKGLTYEGGLAVAIGGKDVTENFSVTPESPAASQDGTTSFTVGCDDVLELGAKAGSTIVVTYTAKLNSNAEIGNPGNPNKVYLEYSNDPNWNGQDAEPTGETPEDQVIVFTYELDVTKVGEGQDGVKLQGAEFVLYRVQDETTEYAVVVDDKVSSWTSDKDKATTLVSGEDGVFRVAGLDAGTYWLKETKAPAGYNLLANPIRVVIAAELDETQEDASTVTSLTIFVDNGTEEAGNASTGVVSMTVENNKGAMLPETGGMGATLFYIVGGILVAGAAALLVVRRRSAGSEE